MRVLSLVLVPLAASALAAQSVPTTRYERAEARFPEPLSMIAGFRALDANRSIAADPLEGRVALLDWSAGSMTDIGRQGGGPGEFGAPGPLFARGDQTLMLDMGNRRLVPIENGRIGRNTIPLGGGDGMPIFPRAMDAQGRIYYDMAGIISPQTAEWARQGRAPILRLDPATNQVDTVGQVGFPPVQATGGPGEVRVQMGGNAFQPRDAWAVTADGRVGVARAAPYRVEWLGARPVTGPDIPYRPVPITDAEKNAWADQMANRGMMVSVENGRRSTRRAPRPDITRMQWPEVMPPFNGTPITSPSGELWVERARPARETARTYDVFDPQGRLVRQVVFPGGHRVLAIGDGWLVGSRIDDDGLEWLERFRM